MSKPLLLSILSVLVLLCSSCKKSDDAPPIAPSIEERNNILIKGYASRLVSKKWLMIDKYTKYRQKGGGFIEVYDYLYNIPSCQKDDFILFHDNGTYTLDHGIEKCTPDETQTLTGSWKMEVLEGTVTKQKYVVLSLDPSAFGLYNQYIEKLTESELITVSYNDESLPLSVPISITTISFKNIP